MLPHDQGLAELQGTRTHENLKAALALDGQASRLSERFAQVAEVEGFPEIARTLREVAETQGFHAQGHLDLLLRAGDPMSGVPTGETAQNVKACLAAHEDLLLAELSEMADTARAEGFPDVASWFDTLRRAREVHRQRLQSLL